ncbi:SUKH-4 family immunity protein [Streptomyces sp. B15]|uniref:SUKH-4 family immunity protein n=1 Tax=Streptomyces sp. B15 TaxID=1537797 RepID=UPI00161122F5|nr:SUKH-4 family immunity protein [Streptomyces sp. B15]MBQ1118980.1 SUKH-4 family immunity protein [Streptomyces sp. B15]
MAADPHPHPHPHPRPWRRLDTAALPETLRHEPSRRFLTEAGLPEQAAELDFASIRDGHLPPLTEDVTAVDAPVALDGQLLVLGRTDHWEARLVLDGEGGGVHLVAWEGEDLCHDLIASGVPELAALLGEIETVSGSPRDPVPAMEPRGLATLTRARTESEQRLRRADPRLYELYDAQEPAREPAHWGAALLVRTLHLAARPGGPGELAYEIEPELVAQLAEGDGGGSGGRGGVRRFTEDELPAGLTHAPTRRLLTEVGLPRETDMFAVTDGPLRTVGEAHPSFFEPGAELPSRAYQRDFHALGWWAGDLALALDGTTGRLELPDWFDHGSPAAYLHQDLSALLFACWTYQQAHAAWARWDIGAGGRPAPWHVYSPKHLLESRVAALVEAVDPAAWATEWHSWPQLENDDHTGGLLCS